MGDCALLDATNFSICADVHVCLGKGRPSKISTHFMSSKLKECKDNRQWRALKCLDVQGSQR